MNKKGFTLIEILAVIILIGLLFGIGIPGVMRISERMKEKSYNTKVGLIEQAGELWGQDNKTRLQTDKCDLDGVLSTGSPSGREYNCHLIKILDLIEADYLQEDEKDNLGNYIYTNPKDNSNISSTCVWVYKKNNRVYASYGVDCEGCVTENCYTLS